MMTVPVSGPIEINSPVATKNAALRALGFCMLPAFIAEDEIEQGKLITCLDEFIVRDGGIYAVYPHRRYSARENPRTRGFYDPMVQGAGIVSPLLPPSGISVIQ